MPIGTANGIKTKSNVPEVGQPSFMPRLWTLHIINETQRPIDVLSK